MPPAISMLLQVLSHLPCAQPPQQPCGRPPDQPDPTGREKRRGEAHHAEAIIVGMRRKGARCNVNKWVHTHMPCRVLRKVARLKKSQP